MDETEAILNSLIGKPYRIYSKEGFDCVSFVRAFINKYRNDTIPLYRFKRSQLQGGPDSLNDEIINYFKVSETLEENSEKPQVVLLHKHRYCNHLGVLYNNKVYHCIAQLGSISERLENVQFEIYKRYKI